MSTQTIKQKIRILFAIISIFLLLNLLGCTKDVITPGNYYPKAELIDSTKWQDDYVNGGVIPTFGNNNTQSNELVGTTWVLTKIQTAFVTTILSDTLHFITNTKYYLNSDSTYKPTYGLYAAQNNVTLEFKPLVSMNYVQCSTNQLGVGFANGPQIIGVEFVNLYNTTTTFKAWFTKI